MPANKKKTARPVGRKLPAPVTPSAEERRATKMNWTASDRAARKRLAEAVRLFRNHYRQHSPEHSQLLTMSAIAQMKQALWDCQLLDNRRVDHGLEPIFVENFTFYDHQAALAGIHCRALAERKALSDGTGPAFAAIKAGDEGKARGKRTLELIRESMRDGWNCEAVLQLNANGIQRMAEVGNASFFEDLGETLREHRQTPLRRSLSAWIVRAWLPLCLWECNSDGQEACDRFLHAADLIGLNIQGADPAKFYHTFVTAWRNARSKRMKLRG